VKNGHKKQGRWTGFEITKGTYKGRAEDMILAWILRYRIYTWKDISMCRFPSPAMKNLSWEDAHHVTDDSLRPWM